MTRFLKTLSFSLTAALIFSVPAMAQQAAPAPKEVAAKADSWTLCPEPQKALNEVPASAEQLQADIDRYTLCVNRAELLMKLETIQRGPESMVNAMTLPGAVTPPPLTAEQTSQLIDNPVGVESVVRNDAPAAPQKDVITVKDIRGVGGELMARVQDQDGNIATVGVGDKLTDGSEITAVSATQVTVVNGGKTSRLDWGQ